MAGSHYRNRTNKLDGIPGRNATTAWREHLRLRLSSIEKVSERHLCCGCGACAYVSPAQVEMVDDLERGRRPLVVLGEVDGLAEVDPVRVCPGAGLEHEFDRSDAQLIPDLVDAWGPVRDVWEGSAADPEIRFAGSSGGAASGLALYCIEHAGMHGLLHIAARQDVPYLNETVMSTTRDELLARTGSRYAPASPCDGLQMIEDAPGPCVFIGKPCDVAAVQKTRKLRPKLDERIGLTIAIFCAGTPSTRGTIEMLQRMGVTDLSTIRDIRYRGNGWPGKTVVTLRTPDGEETRELTYEQSWGEVLEKHRQWRCYVCVDHSGEFADISVGDPWYRPIRAGEPGQSLVLARTERGRQILRAAMEAGYLTLKKADPGIVERSQPGFPTVRGLVWARIWACRFMGAAAPHYRNMPMFRFWWSKLTLKQKLLSFVGTIRRVFRKKLLTRSPTVPYEPPCTRTVAHAASVGGAEPAEAYR
jgi:coenzyme F420 hydrogenase subunit beta